MSLFIPTGCPTSCQVARLPGCPAGCLYTVYTSIDQKLGFLPKVQTCHDLPHLWWIPQALFFLGVLFAVGGLERVGILKAGTKKPPQRLSFDKSQVAGSLVTFLLTVTFFWAKCFLLISTKRRHWVLMSRHWINEFERR